MGGCCDEPDCNLIADFHFDTDKLPEQWDELITDGGGVNTPTSLWDDDGYVEMKVPDDADRIVRQSKEYYRARGQKMVRAQFTAVLNIDTTASTAAEGSTSRVGMFDSHDDKTVVAGDVGNAGFFFEYRVTDTTTLPSTVPTHPLYVGVRYGAITAGTDTLIRQDAFNVNDLNRNSHISISDWSKLYTFEILYNAIGFVEWAIYLDGERILLHKEQDISKTINTLPRFNMPARFEITNTDTAAAGLLHEMRQFNSSVCVDDKPIFICGIPSNTPYKIKHLSNLTTKLFTVNTMTYEPVFSFRLKEAFIREPIRLYELLYLVHKKGPFSYAIVRNANLTTGNASVWIDSGSKLEYDVTANIATDATDIVYEQFVDADCHGGIQYTPSKICVGAAPLTSDIAGNIDTFTVVIRKQSQLKMTANFGFRYVI